MEGVVKQMGFKDLAEFNRLVASVDISSSERLTAFKNWQENDGTREGLVKLLLHCPVCNSLDISANAIGPFCPYMWQCEDCGEFFNVEDE